MSKNLLKVTVDVCFGYTPEGMGQGHHVAEYGLTVEQVTELTTEGILVVGGKSSQRAAEGLFLLVVVSEFGQTIYPLSTEHIRELGEKGETTFKVVHEAPKPSTPVVAKPTGNPVLDALAKKTGGPSKRPEGEDRKRSG